MPRHKAVLKTEPLASSALNSYSIRVGWLGCQAVFRVGFCTVVGRGWGWFGSSAVALRMGGA